ncbi:MAG: hypothetical protein K2H36_03445 [Clostridia bacterium]|nr:hypothetical protein [Clostridia bacterium]
MIFVRATTTEWCDFCPCDDNRVVSVLTVRDPEGVLVVRTKGAPLYAVVTTSS